MQLPFGTDEFFNVFVRYNEAVEPVQVILIALAIVAIVFHWIQIQGSNRWVSAILATLWAWSGIAYHLIFFRAITPVASVFGTAFVIQALLFFYLGVWQGRLRFDPIASGRGVLALLLVLYALIIYPILNYALGHSWMDMPTFGTPCPITIFTVGFLLLLRHQRPLYVLVIPLVWTLIGTSAAWLLDVVPDLGLLVVGLLLLTVTIRQWTVSPDS